MANSLVSSGMARSRWDEVAHLAVEREAVRALAHRQHQHGGRAVDGITRGHLAGAGLQVVADRRLLGATVLQHREDGAHRHVDIGVRRAVQRVEDQQVRATGEVLGDHVRCVQLFAGQAGHQATPLGGLDHRVVGQHVQLLLLLALHVGVLHGTQVATRLRIGGHAAEGALGRHRRDGLDGGRHVHQQRGQLALVLNILQLLDQELGEGGASEMHGGAPGRNLVVVVEVRVPWP